MDTTRLILKRSNEEGKVPTPTDIVLGELAVNTHDGKIFLQQDRDGNITIREVHPADIADNVLYVSKNGNDLNSGKTIADAFGTLDKALSEAITGTTIFLKSGTHTIDNSEGGIDVPAFVSIVGDNLRTTSINGISSSDDLLYVNNGTFITGVTFRNHAGDAAAVSFNPNGSAGMITTSPYIQNCSSITFNGGTGMRIDGSYVTGLKSMVSDAFTQINFGGKGIHILNEGYAQLVSIFTISCDIGIFVESGGQCSLTNSNCSFGNYGLKATGTGPELYSGTTSQDFLPNTSTIEITGLSERPKYNDAIKFDTEARYYTVENATPLDNGTSIVTLNERLDSSTLIPENTTVKFYQRSLIAASSITFEYIGTGTNIFFNTPRSGAFPIQENEVIEDSDGAGQVYFTSTDHKGDFRIGGELVINRASGTIEGTTFDRSLFAILTPYILALED
jgi:hypothetical protein